MSDSIKLRITRRSHHHNGKLLTVGDEFDGTERLLKAFGDRLERVGKAPAAMPAPGGKARKNADASDGK